VLSASLQVCFRETNRRVAENAETPQRRLISKGIIMSTARVTYSAVPTRRINFKTALRLTLIVTAMLSLLLVIPTNSSGTTRKDKRKGRSNARSSHRGPSRSLTRALTRAEMKAAQDRLAEMGYLTRRAEGAIDGGARNALIAFQKWEGRKVTGRMSREDFDAIMSAAAPQEKDKGYRHVEVDLDRQVLLFVDDEGEIKMVLPVSSGSKKQYREKGGSGLAYTPRGRFRINAKVSGWRRSSLGLLYYPNYFSGGVAIHGNPSVPNEPQSHGCVRIPMSAAEEVSRLLPLGTIVLTYDRQSFVSAKDWAVADMHKPETRIR
jgi:hypothetical protein